MATQFGQPAPASAYNPFAPGPFSVGVRTIEARDSARGRQFPCEIWYPAARQETGEAELRDICGRSHEPFRGCGARTGPSPG